MGFVFLACARVGLRACVWFLGVVRPACLVGVRVWGALGVFGGRVRGRGRVWLRACWARAVVCSACVGFVCLPARHV